MKKFDLNSALAAGYSQSEINTYLASQGNFNYSEARKEGYSDDEIYGFLSAPPSYEAPAPLADPYQGQEIPGKGFSHGQSRPEPLPELPLIQEEARGMMENPFELKAHGANNPQWAKTPSGQLNILKKSYPNAELDIDEDGQAVFRLNDSIGEYGEEQDFVMNKKGPSMQDIGLIPPYGVEAGLAIGGSFAAAGKGLAKGMAMSGVGGGIGQGVRQAGAEALGGDEGFNLADMMMAAGMAAGGEGVGRSVAAIASSVAGTYAKVTGRKLQGDPFGVDGKIKPEIIADAESRGVSAEDFSRIMGKDIKKLERSSGQSRVEIGSQSRRASDFESLGLSGGGAPTKAQITRSTGDFRSQGQAEKIGHEGMVDRLNNQNETLQLRARQISEGTGGAGKYGQDRGDSVISGLSESRKLQQDRVGELYKEARETFGPQQETKIDNLIQAIDDVEVGDVGGYGDRLLKVLKRKGLVNSDGMADSASKGMKIERMETLRKGLNQSWSAADKQGKMVIGELKDAIDKDVTAALGKDNYSGARKAAYDGFKLFTSKKGANRTIEKLLDDNTFAKDVHRRTVLNSSVEELQAVKSALLDGAGVVAPVKGKAAWDNLRKETVEHFLTQATRAASPNERGVVDFNAAAWSKAVNKLRSEGDDKLKALFSEKELKSIIKLGETGMLLSSPRRGAAGSDTASNLTLLAQRLPWLGGMIRGASELSRRGGQSKEADQALKFGLSGVEQARRVTKRRVRSLITPPSLAGGVYLREEED